MGKRLSNTAAIERESFSGQSHSISVRKIDNGYLVSKSSCGPDGDYRSSESFHRQPPRISEPRVGRQARDSAGDESLADTVDYMKSKGM